MDKAEDDACRICKISEGDMDEQEFEAYLAKERQKYEQMIARSIERTDKHGEHLRSVISSLVEETR